MAPEAMVSESATLELTSLEKLERRIRDKIEQLRAARDQRAVAEQEVARLQGLLTEKEAELARLTAELEELRSERRQVRERIEVLLQQIERLEE